MIRQLSVDCGYSSSALREQLYLSESADSGAMNGVLIYTGSPDSEGSLGGLVRLADPYLSSDAVIRAVHAARWCGSDPVCLETDPHQSGERISGAACHCCLLVPETACEKFNRELDRSMLVGAADGSYRGFSTLWALDCKSHSAMNSKARHMPRVCPRAAISAAPKTPRYRLAPMIDGLQLMPKLAS